MRIGKISRFKLNVFFGFLNSIISAIQTFWFIPYVKINIGTSAYGYISVINGLVNTLFVLANAVGSMGTRFILVSYEQNKVDQSNKYFNSECVAMLISSVFILVTSIFFSFYLQYFMNIGQRFRIQVQVLFVMTIFSFALQLLLSPFSSSFFYKNTLYITYILFTLDYLGRILLTIVLYRTGNKVLWSAALATDIVYLFSLFVYYVYFKREMINIELNIKFFSIKHLFEMIKSGIWIAISSAGNIMLSSLNTYFSNLFCGVFITGIYAAIMQLNIVESMILSVLVNTLLPKMFKLFSDSSESGFFNYTVYSMSIISLLLSIVSGGIIVYGNDFMSFWMGPKFTGYQLLMFLTVIYLPFTLPSQVLNQSFTVMNKVSIPAIITVFSGILNVVLVVIMCNIFNMDIYGVAISSLIVQILRDCFLYPYYYYKISHYFNIKIIYPFIFAALGVIVTYFICRISRSIFYPKTLILFFVSVAIGGGATLLLLFPIIKKLETRFNI